MTRSSFIPALLCVTCLVGMSGARAQDNIKLGQSGMQFLSVVSDARASALAGAMTSLPMQSASMFFNPATMANTTQFLNISASYNEWIADIKHSAIGISVRPADGDFGVFGLSAQIVDYGIVQGTVVSTNAQGFEETGDVKPSAVALGFGYAKALSEVFSVGIHVKWVHQTLGTSAIPLSGGGFESKTNAASVAAFDFGTIFKTGLKSLTFGMSVRNFSEEVKFQEETFSLPLTFAVGISMDAMDFFADRTILSSLLVSVDAVHNRDYREQMFFGVECGLMGTFALRGGYIGGSDEAGATMGLGVQQFGIQADYSYTPFGVFNNVHRVTLRLSL